MDTVVLRGYYARVFVAVQRCTVPLSRELDEEQQQESLRLINHFLQTRPDLRVPLKLFLISIDTLSILTGLNTFQRLSSERQVGLMNWFFDSRIPLLRKGFWGLNTLARLGVYGQSSLHEKIGYRIKPIPNERTGS